MLSCQLVLHVVVDPFQSIYKYTACEQDTCRGGLCCVPLTLCHDQLKRFTADVPDCYALTWMIAIVLQCAAEKRKRGEHTQLTLLYPSQTTTVTLANMIPQSFQDSFKEEHMQPVLIDLLQTALLAARGDCILLDMHKCSNQLHGPIAWPDCILAASDPKPHGRRWSLFLNSRLVTAKQR